MSIADKDQIQEKLAIPYYQVAKQALMNWNGLSEEEAEKIIKYQSFEEIESKVYAKGSMDYAIEGIAKSLSLNENDSNSLSDAVYNGNSEKNGDALKGLKSKIEESKFNPNDLIMDTLFHVHDAWVKDNVKKFDSREKKHQHMPSELIGWKEVKADLLFVKPIFEAAGIEVNEKTLEQVYNNRVKEFFLNNNIKTKEDLAALIQKGEEFYEPLKGYGDTSITDPETIKSKVIPQIEEKGIGSIEGKRKEIISQIISNPSQEDLSRLTDEENEQIEKTIEQEVSSATEQRDELHQKNAIVQRIMSLAKKRSELKMEIAEEEKTKEKNVHDFNE